jgi:hypothetical protein
VLLFEKRSKKFCNLAYPFWRYTLLKSARIFWFFFKKTDFFVIFQHSGERPKPPPTPSALVVNWLERVAQHIISNLVANLYPHVSVKLPMHADIDPAFCIVIFSCRQ